MSDDLLQRLRRLSTIHEREQEVIRTLREQEARAFIEMATRDKPVSNVVPFKPRSKP